MSQNLLLRFLKARYNLLAPFGETEFHRHFFSFRILRQKYVVCNSPEHVREAFLDKHANFDRKSPQHRAALEPIAGDGLFISDGELWAERREICAPALRSDLLPLFVPQMVGTALETRERWENLPPHRPVDLLHEMATLTARIIARTVFGDDVPEADAKKVVEGFTEYQKSIEQLSFADCTGIPALRMFSNPLRKGRTQRAAARVHEVVNSIIARRRNDPDSAPHTLLSLFLRQETTPGKCPMSDLAARNEAIIMFLAGHETTANVMTWCWYLLDGDRTAREKLDLELETVLAGRVPTLDDLPNLPFTRAVIEETMRLYPPVPMLSRQARGMDTIGGRPVSPDTILLVVPWLLHRHRDFWQKPDEFHPERFLPDQPRPDKCLYLPFSVGPRVCLGMRFGLTEAMLCLAILAQKFRPKVIPNHRVEIECRLTLRPHGGMPALLERCPEAGAR